MEFLLICATWIENAGRFLTLEDEFVRASVLGAVLLGLNCGALGSFLVVRRMSLVGDTLSHAVLPGIVGGYLWNQTKDPVAMLIGAIIAGVIGTMLMNAITSTTKIKSDAAQGIILTVFFAIGVCLISLLPPGNKGGVDRFLFGQLAAVSAQDISWLSKATAITGLSCLLGYRGLLVLSFDPVFGRLCGLPMRFLHYGLMLLTTLAIVVAMESVGVVLVSAMLVIPASAASLLTQRLHWLILMAGAFGVTAGLLGTFLSFVGDQPTGPMVVIAASGIFALAFGFSPRTGLVTGWWSAYKWNRQVEMENDLKSIYRHWEDQHGEESSDAQAHAFSPNEFVPLKKLRSLQSQGLVEVSELGGDRWKFTTRGLAAAQRVVRHHRLWELYLSRRASYPADHVHDDAEKIEHLMDDDQARRLAEQLGNPTCDPHGRPIP